MSLTIKRSSQQVIFKKMLFMSNLIKRNVREVVEQSTKAIQKEAKARAPSDRGQLRNFIERRTHNEGLTGVVFTPWQLTYAHLVEFGTGSFYKPPPGVGRGKGGSPYRPPAGGLLGAWAKRKGLPVFPIARSIGLKGGVKGRPFLFPAFQGERRVFVRNLRRAIWNKGVKKIAKGAA